MTYIAIKNVVVFTVNAKDEIFQNATVLIHDERIVEIVPSGQLKVPMDVDRVIDCKGGMALLPGLVDVHSHSSLMRGITENMQLMEWLPYYQLEHRAMDEEDAFHAARLCYLEALKSGTTCVMDMYRYMHRCADAAGEIGLRVHLAPYAADVPGKDFFETPAANRKLIETHHLAHHGRIKVWMGLEHLFYCTREAYVHARECAREYGIGIHTHASEQREEEAAVLQRFGKRSIPMLDEMGVLGERTLIAHCVWLNSEEIRRLADTGTSVAHCPSSNAKLASGIAPIVEMREAGVKVGLGTDGNVCNNSLDLFEEMKFSSLLQKVTRFDAAALPAKDMLRMATIDGARVLGMGEQIGSIEVGKKADLILLDLQQPNMQPLVWEDGNTNVLWNIVFSARGSNVKTVIVDGDILLADGLSTKVDEGRVMAAAQSQAELLMRKRRTFQHTLGSMTD